MRGSCSPWIVLASLASLAVAAAAASAAPAAPPAQDPVAKEIESMRGLMLNARAKLNRGLVEMDSATSRSAPATPFERCCTSNLEKLGQGLVTLREAVQKASACYEQRRDRPAVDAANLAVQDLRSMSTALNNMAKAPTLDEAMPSYSGAERAFLNLNKSMAAMPPCGTWIAPVMPKPPQR